MCSLSASDRLVIRVTSTKGERQSTSIYIAPALANAYMCTIVLSSDAYVECIAMLPFTYADVQAVEPRLVNRIRGSSPL